MGRDGARLLLTELRGLLRQPHPNVAVFPSANARFWRLVVEGPSDTVYGGGAWLCFLKFPADFPSRPPEFKFVTPIRHCNINQHGRVCHSVLDRNWTADTSVFYAPKQDTTGTFRIAFVTACRMSNDLRFRCRFRCAASSSACSAFCCPLTRRTRSTPPWRCRSTKLTARTKPKSL
jgi:hypothetical protein